MVKVIIANNNDILFNSLSNTTLQYKGKIEIVNVPTDKLENFICQIGLQENLIILDSATSVIFCNNILKYIMNRKDKANVIILVIDSKTVTNIVSQEKQPHLFFFRKEHTDFSILDAINLITNSVKNITEIERSIDDILWRLGFASYFKGTIYLKDASNTIAFLLLLISITSNFSIFIVHHLIKLIRFTISSIVFIEFNSSIIYILYFSSIAKNISSISQ